jgi:hypothetical protein
MMPLIDRLSVWLDRTAFPRIADAEAEAHKVAVLRIAAGLVLVWRCALMLRDSWYYFDPVPLAGGVWPLHVIAAAAQLVLALGLTLGVMPVYCAVLLLATHPAYSIWTETYNLGPMLLTPMLGAFAALESGRFALFARIRPAPTAGQYRAAYLILFTAYAGMNFQALLYHVGDAYWVSGQTVAVLFTSSYLSEFYGLLRAWESATPGLYALFSIVVGVLQSVFQLAMLPLVVTRWGARFVHLWGWAFIFGSLVGLQLSVLPAVEVIIWALIFSPARWFAFGGGSITGNPALTHLRFRAAAIGIFCSGYGLLLLLFYINAITDFTLKRDLPGWIRNPVLYYSGLVAPNVFNQVDLTMGDRWPVLYRLDGEHRGMVPLNGPEGERLAYHRSDLLYFGNSLRWRRGMIWQSDLAAYHQPGADGYEYARRMALYDYRRHGATGNGLYHFSLFRNHASEFALGADPTRYRPELVLDFTLPAFGTHKP